jgi:cytosine/uracil/thiamine/allantoin permease
VAIVAFAVGIAPLIPGFLATIVVGAPPTFLLKHYEWSWFVAFALAGGTYWAGMTITGAARVPLTTNGKAPSHG